MQTLLRKTEAREELRLRKDEVQRRNASTLGKACADVARNGDPNDDLLDQEELLRGVTRAALLKRVLCVHGSQVMDLTDPTYLEACEFSARLFPLLDGAVLARPGTPQEWVNTGSTDGLPEGASVEERSAARNEARAEFMMMGVVPPGRWQVRCSGEWRDVSDEEDEVLKGAYLNQEAAPKLRYTVGGESFEACPSVLRRRTVASGESQDLRFKGVLPFDPIGEADGFKAKRARSLPDMGGKLAVGGASRWYVVIYYEASKTEKVEAFFEWAGLSIRDVEEMEVDEPADDTEAYLQLLVPTGRGARFIGRSNCTVFQGLAAVEAPRDKSTVSLRGNLLLKPTAGPPEEVETVEYSKAHAAAAFRLPTR